MCLCSIVYSLERMEAEDLANAIADLDRREQVLLMELEDVLTDVTTPESSDVDEDAKGHREDEEQMKKQRQKSLEKKI